MLKTVLIEDSTNRTLETREVLEVERGGGSALVTVGPYDLKTRVASVTRSSAGTSVVTQPVLGGGILVRDIIVSSKKSNSTNVQVNWTDGTNSITFVDIDNTDGIKLHIPFAVPLLGFRDARLEVTTDGSFDCTVTCTYVKFPSVISYEEWQEDA